MEVGKSKEGYAYVGEGYKNKENAAHASDYILKAYMRSDTKEGLHVAVDQIKFRVVCGGYVILLKRYGPLILRSKSYSSSIPS